MQATHPVMALAIAVALGGCSATAPIQAQAPTATGTDAVRGYTTAAVTDGGVAFTSDGATFNGQNELSGGAQFTGTSTFNGGMTITGPVTFAAAPPSTAPSTPPAQDGIGVGGGDNVVPVGGGASSTGGTTCHDNAFLELDGITGESRASGHVGETDVLGFAWGLSVPQAVGATGMAAGKPHFDALTITKRIDKTTPLLFQHAASGQSIANLDLKIYNCGNLQTASSEVKLTGVLVSSIATDDGLMADGVPTEKITFTFQRIQWIVTPTQADGTPSQPESVSWDLKANKKI